MNSEWFNGLKRRARDPETGKTYIVSNMNYEEWYKTYVDSSGKKKTKNKKN